MEVDSIEHGRRKTLVPCATEGGGPRYTARTGIFAQSHEASIVDSPTRGRPRQNCVPKPIAPYSRDPIRALGTVCDRVTGEPVNAEQLKTYAEALAQYHLNCEDKFSNGQFCDRGRT